MSEFPLPPAHYHLFTSPEALSVPPIEAIEGGMNSNICHKCHVIIISLHLPKLFIFIVQPLVTKSNLTTTYLLTCPLAYSLACLLTCKLACSLTYVFTCCLLNYLFACLLACLFASLLLVRSLACWVFVLVCQPVSLLAYLSACLPAYSSVELLNDWLHRSHVLPACLPCLPLGEAQWY